LKSKDGKLLSNKILKYGDSIRNTFHLKLRKENGREFSILLNILHIDNSNDNIKL
jgi:hypothetical protein